MHVTLHGQSDSSEIISCSSNQQRSSQIVYVSPATCLVKELTIVLGALQIKNFSKNPRLLWKWVGGSRSHSEFFFENHPKTALK